MKKTLLIMSVLIASCGSDNKSKPVNSETNIEGKSFSLEKVNNLAPGVVYSSELKDTETTNYGYIKIENLPETTEDGVLITPQYRYFYYSHSRFGSGNISAPTWETTLNIDTTTKNLISFKTFVSSSGMGPKISCVSLSPYHLPTQIKLGDKDTTPGFKCDNNINIAPGSWHTEAGTDGNLKFIVRTQTIDLSGKIIDEDITYTITQQGNIVALQVNSLKSFSDR